MSTCRLSVVMSLVLTVAASARDRAWPYFRTAGMRIEPGRPLPAGPSLANGSIEMRLKKDDARLMLVGKDGRTLLRATISRPAGSHVVVVWGEHIPYYQPWVYVDGKNMTWNERSRAAAKEGDAEVWRGSARATLKLEGAADDLRLYPYAMTPPELANAYALAAGKPLVPLAPLDTRFDYRMSIGRMDVLMDVKAHFGRATAARAAFHMGGKALASPVAPLSGGTGVASFDVGELPAGKYPVAVTVLDAGGKALHQETFSFERIELPWLHSRAGLDEKVYPPFEAVKVEGRRVSCVLRTYGLGDSGLPESIAVKGREILAAPVAYELAGGGEATALKSDGRLVMGRTTDCGTSWRGTVSGGGLTIASNVRFEFDGMARYELTIAPTAGPVKIDALALAVPLKADCGDKIHALPIGGSFRDYEVSRRLPAADGLVWDSKTGFPRGDVKPTVGSFAPMVWLGGTVRGLCWFADSDRGWAPSERRPAVTVTRERGAIVLRLHFVSESLLLDAPRKIVFALLATPAKPLPKDYRAWGRGDIGNHPLVGGRIMSCDSFAPWKTPAREQAFDVFPRDYDFRFAARCAAEQRGSGGKYAPGQPMLMYQDHAWGRTGRDGLYFDWEWKAKGVRRQPLTWSSPSLVDCRAWYWQQYLARNVYDGIYLDDAFPVPNYNWQTCSGYRLPDGRVQPGTSFFGLREYLKRVWNLCGAHGRRPIITVHMSSALMLPALTFATSIYDGEDTQRMGKHDFLHVWPMERFQVLDDAERTGLVTMFMFKGSYAEKYGPDLLARLGLPDVPSVGGKAGPSPAVRSAVCRAVWTGWLLHDLWYGGAYARLTDRDGKRCEALRVLSRYAGTDTVFHAYYKSGARVKVRSLRDTPVPRDQLPATWYRSYWSEQCLADLAVNPVKASVYEKPGRLLVAVGNYAYVPVPAEVTVDLAALGVPGDKLAAVQATDVDDWPIKEPSVDRMQHSAGVIRCTVPAHSFRLFELTW